MEVNLTKDSKERKEYLNDEFNQDIKPNLISKKEQVKDFIENPENDDYNLNQKERILTLLAIEYDYLEKQQNALFYSNEEMEKYSLSDKDIIECRAENLKIIEKNLVRMKQIRQDIIALDKDHYILNKEVFSCFNINNLIKESNSNNIEQEQEEENETSHFKYRNNQDNIIFEEEKEKEEETIIKEIEL